MNPDSVAKHYKSLTPEERFRLILAASGRSDDVDRDRLAQSGSRLNLSWKDHAPFAKAFDEIASLAFLELLEDAQRYVEFWNLARSAADDEKPKKTPKATPKGKEESPTDSIEEELTEAEHCFDLAMAAGFVLKTRAAGWQLFCERLSVPPFVLWEVLPGYERLKRALDRTERAAFVAEGFLRWMNHNRPAEDPPWTELTLTASDLADATEAAFRERVAWWGGEEIPRLHGP